MAAKKDTELKLVATRVSPSAFRVLQIALVVEGAESMQELLRPIVEAYAKALEAEPEVRAIMDNVDEYRARKTGVARLPRSEERAARPPKSADEKEP